MNFFEKYYFYHSTIFANTTGISQILYFFFQIKKYATAMFRAQQKQLFNKMISYEQGTLSATNQ